MPLYSSVTNVSSFTRRNRTGEGAGGGGGYTFTNAEAEAVVAAFSTEPDDTRKEIIDDLVGDLKAAGVWSKLILFYAIAAHAEQAGRINWISPGDFTLTENGTSTFTTDRGEAGNGTNGYLDTGWNPATDGGGVFTQNSAHLGMFVTAFGNGNHNLSRSSSGAPNLMTLGTTYQMRINGSAGGIAGSVTTDTVTGHYVFTRTNTACAGYRNGYVLGTGTGASSALDTNDLFIGRSVTSYSTDQHGFMHAGAYLTALEVDQMYLAINKYMVALEAYDSYLRGGWSWFSTRRALLTAGGDLWMGVTTPKGEFAFIKEGRAPQILKFPLIVDDHQNPVVLKRSSDGKLITHYRAHASDNYFQRISTNADDPTAWGAETSLAATFTGSQFSYANLMELTDGIFTVFRRAITGGRTWYYSLSTDNGATWSAGVQIIDGANPYIRVVKSGANRFDMAITSVAPGAGGTNTLTHLYYDAGTWRDSAGNDLGSAPHAIATDPTAIYTSDESWIWDIAFNTVPVVVFGHYPTSSDHRYRYGKWNGTSWDTYEICVMGGGGFYVPQDYYSGGICIDPDDINTIYCSRRDGNDVFQIWKGVTTDGGATWTLTQLTNEAVWCIRPNKEAGSNVVQFMKGDYTAIDDFDTVVAQVAA